MTNFTSPSGRIVIAGGSGFLGLNLARYLLNVDCEVVLLSLLALVEGGPGEAEPVVLKRVLDSLMAFGLEKEVRALSLEAAVAELG